MAGIEAVAAASARTRRLVWHAIYAVALAAFVYAAVTAAAAETEVVYNPFAVLEISEVRVPFAAGGSGAARTDTLGGRMRPRPRSRNSTVISA
jgi:hypothetical protein